MMGPGEGYPGQLHAHHSMPMDLHVPQAAFPYYRYRNEAFCWPERKPGVVDDMAQHQGVMNPSFNLNTFGRMCFQYENIEEVVAPSGLSHPVEIESQILGPEPTMDTPTASAYKILLSLKEHAVSMITANLLMAKHRRDAKVVELEGDAILGEYYRGLDFRKMDLDVLKQHFGDDNRVEELFELKRQVGIFEVELQKFEDDVESYAELLVEINVILPQQ